MDAWQLDTWEDYRDVNRIGRYRRLVGITTESRVAGLRTGPVGVYRERGLLTKAQLFGQLTREVLQQEHPPFDHVVVDEAQDVSVAQLRFLAALAGGRPNGLFFAGDLGQRIFQQPFSWKELGVEIRGRSQTLKINYRTSHQIRTRTLTVFWTRRCPTLTATWRNERVRCRCSTGRSPLSMCWKTRTPSATRSAGGSAPESPKVCNPMRPACLSGPLDQFGRAEAAVELSGLPYTVLDGDVEAADGHVAVGTMHLAKGLEFRAVAVVACDSEVIPLQSRVESITDESDLEEVYNTERNLLYVACTRARDHLLVTGVEPASEFLDDMRM